ncbi:ATPase, T2SS/T4P/T4SS family [Orbaceae bacterium ESL0721]|nr:ATPase, T2SS/T4P/T4SS family [Orbaceae bacterium ESL0721]
MPNGQLIENIDQILLDALLKRASDIHFEPYKTSYRVRMRIDGVLQMMFNFPIEMAKQIAARLKIMAKLDIAEQRLPQDGQLIINNYAMRISTLPVVGGEKIVLRVMDNQEQQLLLTALGLSKADLSLFSQCLQAPQGLILVTGPTGSGKSVTLYSGLKSINQIDRNICSVEDPIEITVAGINQTQVNLKAGLTFAQILRALLRQDPDVLMVGEIRDYETAAIAIQAAQTGHLVLSTLHTNSTIEAITRLNQMGIANYLLASSLQLVIAQRLVRKLCKHCKRQAEDKITFNDLQNYTHFLPTGCQHCIGGYHGRVGIYEFLVITPEIQQQIVNQRPITPQQMIPTAGCELVKSGVTSFAEIERVLGFTNLNSSDCLRS